MFNTLYPKVYRLLRERAGLTQEELGEELGISRYTVSKVEAGKARLTEDQEKTLLEIAECTREEAGELLCQALSEYLKKKVGIQNDQDVYEPTTTLAMASALLREHGANLPAIMRRTLSNWIDNIRLLGHTFDQNNADLVELIHDCREALGNKRRETAL